MAIKCIGLITAGGDSPGMNAAIRAVTRSAICNGFTVKAVYRGFHGLIKGEFVEFKTQNVSNIIQQGGTILRTSPSQEFANHEDRQKAYENLVANGVDALIVIGSAGTMAGTREFAHEYDIPCIGIPATIDNDVYGTDTTIGYDTALNTIVDAVDKIRDTATSHERLFFIEVRGGSAAGFLALNGGIASGCEETIIPEIEANEDQIGVYIQNGFKKAKGSSIVLVAESKKLGGAIDYAERVKSEHPELNVRVSILRNLLRGGQPSAYDRILASRMGVASINALLDGQRNVMIGIQNEELVYVPFSRVIRNVKPIDRSLMVLLHNLSI